MHSVSGPIEGSKAVQNSGRDRAAIDRKLRDARALARLGDLSAARLLCAEIVLAYKPLLCSDPALLTAATESLVHARSWHLLEHLLLAALGRKTRFVVVPDIVSETPAPLIRRTEARGVVTYVTSAGLFSHPDADALIESWGRALAEGAAPGRKQGGTAASAKGVHIAPGQ